MTEGSQAADEVSRGTWYDHALIPLGVGMALFHLVAASTVVLIPGFAFRGVHLLFALLIGFLIHRRGRGGRLSAGDWMLLMMSLLSMGYIIVNHENILARVPWTQEAEWFHIVLAVMSVIVVLELTRRSLGPSMPIVCLVFLAYAFVGPVLRHWDLTRPLAHAGANVDTMVDQIYLSFEGIFGVALGISANYIFLFVLFGAFLQQLGGGAFFIDMTKSLAGAWKGGPAKMAVVASAIFGTISGSAAANVVTTGSFTIPMMKRLGYKAVFAGAVEAVASTGGQIIPPVMGAGAFIMAEFLGISYFEVAWRAAVPAFLFYATLFVAIHLEALRENLPPVPANEIRPAREVFAYGWTYLLPLIGLVALMAVGYTPTLAGFYAVLMTAVIPALRAALRVPLKHYLTAIVEGAKSSIPVVTACAAAGIIIGVVNMSGLGFRFSSLVINLSGGSLIAALILTMICATILGMGLPTTPAYIIQATLIVPALVQLGVKPIAAHMFCFYYAVLAQITPPVAIACFAAAPLAKANATDIGFRAFRLALPVYFVPYLFVYDPGLLGVAGFGPFSYAFVKAIIACAGVAACSEGNLFGRNLPLWERCAFMGTAATVIYPSMMTDIIGTIATIGLGLFCWWQARQVVGLHGERKSQ